MRSCAYGSMIGAACLSPAIAFAACHDGPPPDVPPVTTAQPAPVAPADVPVQDASISSTDAAVKAAAPSDPRPVQAAFVDVPATIPTALCERLFVAVAKGKISAQGESLGAGDVLVVVHGEPFEAKGEGVAVIARIAVQPCAVSARPATEKRVVRAGAAPELRFAGGKMAVHLDVNDRKVSPDLYLGRLEGSAAVAEHTHPGSWEILAAFEASGTFVLEGTEAKLGPRQIVMVPPNAKHAWKPDPSSKLVAIQMYTPPGPEQRFVALAAADKDAGAPKSADAGTK